MTYKGNKGGKSAQLCKPGFGSRAVSSKAFGPKGSPDYIGTIFEQVHEMIIRKEWGLENLCYFIYSRKA